ncbi:MAG: hypothetical protein IPK83_12250 [Planctomycetes bacterium]|nr:hypothetical protein [Planctomycetota bacterium]
MNGFCGKKPAFCEKADSLNESAEKLAATFRRQVVAPLEKLGRTIKRQVLIDGLACCAGALVAMAVGQFWLDRLLVLGLGPRMVLAGVVVGVFVHQFYRRVIRSLGLRVNVNDVASLLERRNPEYGDRLVSAVAFATGANDKPLRNSPALVDALVADSLQSLVSIRTDGVLRRDQFGRRVAIGIVALFMTFAAFVSMPDLMSAYIQRNWLLRDATWPVSVKIVADGFEDGRLRWPIGDDLKIVARAVEGDVPSLYVEFEYASGESVSRIMDRLGTSQFILDYGPLVQAMKVRFVISQIGVDERTEWYSVDAVSRPGVRSVRIEVSPPAYTDKEPFVLARGQASADVIRGSSVRIDAEMNKPLTSATLKSRSDDSAIGEVEITEGLRLAAQFVPSRKGTYFFDVKDADGLDDRSPVTYSFNLLSDPPPKVRLTLPGAGDMIVPSAQLRLAVECEDDLGMQSVSLIHQTRAGGSETIGEHFIESLPDFTQKQQKYSIRHTWPLLPLSLKPGDQLTLFIRASDYQPNSAPDQTNDASGVVVANDSTGPDKLPLNASESIRYSLKVVTSEDLLAELGRRENEWRPRV